MKKSFLLCLAFLFYSFCGFSQGAEYEAHVKNAESFYEAKEYRKAADEYSAAFKSNGWKGMANHRYSAAGCWAQAAVPDSAFFQLNRIITRVNFQAYDDVINNKDFIPLHKDERWQPTVAAVKANKDKAEANIDRELLAKLDAIHDEDQKYRQKLDDVEKKYGVDSKEVQALWDTIKIKDDENLVKVKEILDTRGWLGPDVVGWQGSSTLFLVIQHSDQQTQEKYLPMMQEAVKNGKASGSNLALLEDRVALGQGKRQTYGSQIGRDQVTNEYYVSPLEDPDNVDKRRASVGLGPLAEYIQHWDMKWDVEQYKKDLPALEAKRKE